MKYDLVCIDMFQTLVDVNSRTRSIWKRILKDCYTEELECQCINQFSKKALGGFIHYESKMETFQTLESIFSKYFKELSSDIGVNFDYIEATEIFLNEHNYATEYEDTQSVFEFLKNRVRICLVSDADKKMMTHLLQNYSFDQVFISEDVKAYKNDPQNRMFKQVLNHYKISPNRVLHIGDSSADIYGANRVGIDSCWINRTDLEWTHISKPKYEIKTLNSIEKLI